MSIQPFLGLWKIETQIPSFFREYSKSLLDLIIIREKMAGRDLRQPIELSFEQQNKK